MHQINAALHRWLVPDEATPSGSKPTVASHDIIVTQDGYYPQANRETWYQNDSHSLTGRPWLMSRSHLLFRFLQFRQARYALMVSSGGGAALDGGI
jgi:hypothetical protein